MADTLFVDVSRSGRFAEAVDYAVRANLMQDISANTFGLNEPMNCAMLATVLYRLEDSPAVVQGNPFRDVAAGTWYTDTVL